MVTRYRFVHAYRNVGFGAYAKGDEAEFDAATADFLLRDSPGCIESVDPEPEARQVEEAPKDRMVKASQNRGRGEQAAMSRADSAALLKDKP